MTGIIGTPSSSFTVDGFTAEQQQQLFSIKLRQMEEEHAIKMQVLRASLKGPEQHEPEGELKPEVLEVSKSLPGVPRALLSSILEAKFDPYNLYKLRAVHSDDSNDRQRFSLDSNGDLKLEKAKGKLKDYGSTSLVWC